MGRKKSDFFFFFGVPRQEVGLGRRLKFDLVISVKAVGLPVEFVNNCLMSHVL